MRESLAMVVAVADGGVIGKDGALPWKLPEDLRHFKAVTLGHCVIMGRKTFESIGRALPGRRNIVVTRSGRHFEGCETTASVEDAVALARQTDAEPRIIGGSEIYAAALPLATKIFLTEVHSRVDGDTFFPKLDPAAWRETSRRPAETEGVEFVTLER